MSATLAPIIDRLAREQAEREATDAEFAALLGISRPLWSQTRDGKLPVGLSLLSGALRAFPDIQDDVLIAVERYTAAKQTTGKAA